MNKRLWLYWFVLALSAFGIMEYVSIVDGNEDTYTLTTTVISYIPEWLFWGIVAPFLLWFVHHFYTYYKKYKRDLAAV